MTSDSNGATQDYYWGDGTGEFEGDVAPLPEPEPLTDPSTLPRFQLYVEGDEVTLYYRLPGGKKRRVDFILDGYQNSKFYSDREATETYDRAVTIGERP